MNTYYYYDPNLMYAGPAVAYDRSPVHVPMAMPPHMFYYPAFPQMMETPAPQEPKEHAIFATIISGTDPDVETYEAIPIFGLAMDE